MQLRNRLCVWFAACYIAASSLVASAYTNELDALNAVVSLLNGLTELQYDGSYSSWTPELLYSMQINDALHADTLSNTIKNWSGQISNIVYKGTEATTNLLQDIETRVEFFNLAFNDYALGFTNFVGGSKGFWSTNHIDLVAILDELKKGIKVGVTGEINAVATIAGSVSVTQGTDPWKVHDSDVHDELHQYYELYGGVPHFRVSGVSSSGWSYSSTVIPPTASESGWGGLMDSGDIASTNASNNADLYAWDALPGKDLFLKSRSDSLVPTNDWTVPVPSFVGETMSFGAITTSVGGISSMGSTNYTGLCEGVLGDYGAGVMEILRSGAQSNNFYLSKDLFVPWNWSASFPVATSSIEVDLSRGFNVLGLLVDADYEEGTEGHIYIDMMGILSGVPGGWSAFIGAVAAARTIMLIGVLCASFVWAWRILREGAA